MEGMFTGIVEEIGSVKAIARTSLSVQARTVLENTKLGDSISVNGACLTVIEIDKASFAVEIMPETRKLTNIGGLRSGDKVNLERAMPSHGRFGGHFVQGHVDATGKLDSLTPEGEAVLASISAPADILRYVVKKGFIAVNGVSLTVTAIDVQKFTVSLVSFTRKSTNLGSLKLGDPVNIEVDIIAKYIEKFYHPDKQEGIIGLLDKYDYLKAR
jgi:riboflavin synthase